MGRKRILIVAFLFSLAMINYIDRTTLSFAIGPIAKQFGLSSIAKGYLFSSFLWSYTLFLIPMGLLVDRFGSKKVAGWGICIWSIATACTGLSTGFLSFLATRLVMGAGEATSNPAGGRVIREWIPAGERGISTAAFNSGSYGGPALCALFAGGIIEAWGWQALFFTAGLLGMVWLLAWVLFYAKPETAKWLGAAERAHILAQRNATTKGVESSTAPVGLLGLLRSKTLWGLALTQGCNVYSQYLFLTWMPSYLQTSKHLTLLKTGFYTAIPYAAAVVLCILIGRISDRLLVNTGAASGRRRNMIAVAMCLASVILLAPLLSNLWILLTLIAIALTGVATTTSLNFALVNDLLPNPKDIGRALAFVVVGGNCFGLLAPIVTGYVIAMTGGYAWAFIVAGGLLVIGAISSLTLTRHPMVVEPPPGPSPVAVSN